MSKHKFSQDQNLKPARASRHAAVVENEMDFAPSPGEAASYATARSLLGYALHCRSEDQTCERVFK